MIRFLCLFLFIALVSCSNEDITPECEIEATVLDMSALNGCGYVFQTDDGKKYEPLYSLPFCATGLSDYAWERNPMWDFTLYHGQRIKFSYEIVDAATICMMGTLVSVTCITEIETTDTPKL